MERIFILDNLRGLAFLFMVFQHIFYFYDLSNDYKTKTSDNELVDLSGSIARTLFILLAGYSVYMAYNKDKKQHLKKRFSRSLEILFHGLLLSLVTYILYPKYFIRFGILHFLALGTFLISFIAPFPKLTILILFISVIMTYPKINPFIDTITGAKVNYRMMDYFSLKKWLPVLLTGLILGQHLDIKNFKTIVPFLNQENILTYLGKNSLNLYTLHIIILLIFFKIIKQTKI
jgi:uncharacterized membrane protein